MRPVSDTVNKIASNTFSRKYISLGKIVTHWREVVGSELADKAQPVKINYRKQPNTKKPLASLDIATTSAYATTLHYQKDLILQRINALFGEGWITSIRFITHVANSDNKTKSKPKFPLTTSEKNYLSDMLGGVEDEDIKIRLLRLGEEILKREKS